MSTSLRKLISRGACFLVVQALQIWVVLGGPETTAQVLEYLVRLSIAQIHPQNRDAGICRDAGVLHDAHDWGTIDAAIFYIFAGHPESQHHGAE